MTSRPLPEVLGVRRSDNPDRVTLDLHVPVDLIHFAGHFSNQPILPGIVQIDWAIHFAQEHFCPAGHFMALENVKFHSLVLPDARLALELAWSASTSRLDFSFCNAQRKVSSGRVQFGAER